MRGTTTSVLPVHQHHHPPPFRNHHHHHVECCCRFFLLLTFLVLFLTNLPSLECKSIKSVPKTFYNNNNNNKPDVKNVDVDADANDLMNLIATTNNTFEIPSASINTNNKNDALATALSIYSTHDYNPAGGENWSLQHLGFAAAFATNPKHINLYDNVGGGGNGKARSFFDLEERSDLLLTSNANNGRARTNFEFATSTNAASNSLQQPSSSSGTLNNTLLLFFF